MKYKEKLNLLLNKFKEANELIKAQGLIKSAIFEIEREIRNAARKDGVEKFLKTRVRPYNNGYEIQIDLNTSNLPADKVRKIKDKYITIAIYPSVFFEDDLARGKPAEIKYLFGDKSKYKDVRRREEIRAIIDAIKREIISFLKK